MERIVPFVKREQSLCPRSEGYTTALSSRYEGWGGGCGTITVNTPSFSWSGRKLPRPHLSSKPLQYLSSMIKQGVLQPYRTDYAKEYRRKHGDRGGCRFADKYWLPSTDPWSNTISTVTKDNMLCLEFF